MLRAQRGQIAPNARKRCVRNRKATNGHELIVRLRAFIAEVIYEALRTDNRHAKQQS